MGTSCLIAFYEDDGKSVGLPEVVLYKHNDGDPDYMISRLKRVLENFPCRGYFDVMNISARVVVALKADFDLDVGILHPHQENAWEVAYVYAIYPSDIKIFAFDIINGTNYQPPIQIIKYKLKGE